MDNGIVPTLHITKKMSIVSLNPCCSEQWYRTIVTANVIRNAESLNPCCSGQWYRTCYSYFGTSVPRLVLILVVVDNGIVPTVKKVLSDKRFMS